MEFNNINNLQRDIQDLKMQVELLQRRRSQIEFPLDKDSKAILSRYLDEVLKDKLFYKAWDSYIYFNDLLDNQTGWSVDDNSGTSSVSMADGGAVLQTLAVANDAVEATRSWASNVGTKPLSFGKEQKFRAAVTLTGTMTNQTAYVVLGLYGTSHYGFQISAGTLKGTVHDSVTQATVTLTTLTSGAQYMLEARLTPNDKVVFYVNGDPLGVLTTNLPNGTHDTFVDLYIIGTDGLNKLLGVGAFEFMQQV